MKTCLPAALRLRMNPRYIEGITVTSMAPTVRMAVIGRTARDIPCPALVNKRMTDSSKLTPPIIVICLRRFGFSVSEMYDVGMKVNGAWSDGPDPADEARNERPVDG